MSRALVVHAFNNSTWEAKAARFVSSKPAWTSQWAPGQPGLHREACLGKRNLSQKKKVSNEHPFPTSEFSRPFKNLFYYYLCVCLLVFFVHACAHVCMHVLWYIKVRGQLSGVGSLLLPCEFWLGTRGVRSVQQVSLSLDSLYWAIYFLKAKHRNIKQGEETQPQSSGVTAMRSSSTCYPSSISEWSQPRTILYLT